MSMNAAADRRPSRSAARRPPWIAALMVACSALLTSGPSSVESAVAPLNRAAADAAQASTFAADLESPWGMEFMPDGRLLVTERAGRLRLIDALGQSMHTIDGLPDVDHRDHGGLLDVTVDPDFDSNRLVYISYTKAGRGAHADRNGLNVARARLSDDDTRLEQLQVLFRQTPRVRSGDGLGGRLAVSGDGHLFITLGDRMAAAGRMRAQSLAYYQGKTLRIRIDGSVPDDNPFVGRAGARPEIWSLGHRNPQGAFVHPRTGALWIAEHGPQGGDEINLVHRGRNYGWPVVTHGCEYVSCAPIGNGTSAPGMEPPLTYWGRPGIAPSNLILYSGAQFPEWRGSVFVGALAGRSVWRLELADDDAPRVRRMEALFADLGERIRDIRQGPDGGLYLLTDGDKARVVRIARQDAAL